MSKGRFPAGSYSKLKHIMYGRLKIPRKVNNNAYQVGLMDEWNISNTSNVQVLFYLTIESLYYQDKLVDEFSQRRGEPDTVA